MISVIIPTFNREKTIKRAIDSVLSQTYSDIECIVVDDCSSDRTEEIVKSIKDKRLKYFKLEKNSGACYARNFGISKSSGEFIAFQDSDDEWLEDKLEKQINNLRSIDADMIFGRLNLYDCNNNFIKKVPRINRKSGFIRYSDLLEKSIISTQTLLVKREILEDITFDVNMPRFQDWDLTLRIAKKYKIYYYNVDCVNLYQQTSSISSNSNKGILALELIFEKHKDAFLKHKKAYASYYISMGECKLKNGEKFLSYFIKSLKLNFSFINIFKMIKIYIKER